MDRAPARDSVEGCQSDLVGGGGSGRTRQAVRYHPARQTESGGSRLCRLAAVIACTFLRPASDVGPLEPGDVPERNRAAIRDTGL